MWYRNRFSAGSSITKKEVYHEEVADDDAAVSLGPQHVVAKKPGTNDKL
jgi:hypothetical protein